MQNAVDTAQVPQTLIQALLRRPQLLQEVLTDVGMAPHVIALWARQNGLEPELEQRAGWLSVAQQPGYYKPLLEVAGSHWRAGELETALPVFRWAYGSWRAAMETTPAYYTDGVKLLGQWGACLYQLDEPFEAQGRWLQALALIADEDALRRLAHIIEESGAAFETYGMILEQAVHRSLPGAVNLWQRYQRLQALAAAPAAPETAADEPENTPATGAREVILLADVANLDMVCREQYGYDHQLDYARLVRAATRCGPIPVKLAFVPDIPETLAARERLAAAGFTVDLLSPKRSHGRIVANADTAMAAYAVRWASHPEVGRVELWTGDGDFLCVREAIQQAWPEVAVVFRSFETGTASGIQRLGTDWLPIAAEYVSSFRYQGQE
ncbi:MAG TPA: NYN domain-containing protein [Anaerolineae bacterium]|nr:NYN domain-containing protein [Anaerolineae bacterium]HXK42084.1 NYN domain-containing protein [Anaerolineae bacterium]